MSANKILIADDDRVVHESLSIYLKAEGYETIMKYGISFYKKECLVKAGI